MTENELINFFHHLGDEPADSVMRPSSSMAVRTDLVRRLRARGRNDESDMIAADIIPDWQTLPGWADPAGLRAAQEFFYRRGTGIFLSLFCAVLPEGYALGGPSAFASRTSSPRSSAGADAAGQCLPANAQFLVDVLTPEALSPRGRGFRSIYRLRLVHALARAHSGEDYPAAQSQADLAAMVAAYIVFPLRGLAILGRPATALENTSYVHFWNVVGHMLGLHPRLRLKSADSAAAFLAAYESRRTETAPRSAGALLNFMNSLLPEGMSHLPRAFLILFLGEERARELGVSPGQSNIAPPLLDADTWLRRMGTNQEQIALISDRTARALLDGLRRFEARRSASDNHASDEEFALPPILAGGWKVNSTSKLKRRLKRFTDRDSASSSGPGRETSGLFPNRR